MSTTKHINKIKRVDDSEISIISTTTRTLTNQDVYNEYASLKIELVQHQQQLQNAKDTVMMLEERIRKVKNIIADLEPYAKEAEVFIDREKQIKEADEDGE